MSNQDFTDSEFQKWVETMSCGDLELPTLPDMERKMSDIRNTYHYKFNENDIEQVVYSLLFIALIGLGFFSYSDVLRWPSAVGGTFRSVFCSVWKEGGGDPSDPPGNPPQEVKNEKRTSFYP